MKEADFRKLRADLQELNSKFEEMGGELDQEVKETLEEYKDRMRKRAEESWDSMKIGGRKMDQFVHENPWKAAGVTMIIGIVIGLLVGNRRD